MTEELKPIDVSKYEVTETGQVLKVPKEMLSYIDKLRYRIINLDKENTELREIIDNSVDKTIYKQLAKKAELADVQRKQLAKSKELIENLLYYVKQCTCERSNYEEIEKDIKEAKLFLSEVEK